MVIASYVSEFLFILITSDLLQILLRNRATDLEAKMDDGTSPLILASRHDLPELVRHLVKAGVKVNGADNQGLFEIVYPPSFYPCLLYTSPSPRDQRGSRMPSSA